MDSHPANDSAGSLTAGREEAFVKAHGSGLGYPFSAFDLTLTPGETPRLLQVRDDSVCVGHWSMFALEPRPNFVAAVVVGRPGCRLQAWELV